MDASGASPRADRSRQGRCRSASLLVAGVAAALASLLLAGAARATPPASAISYFYDDLGRLVGVSDPGSETALYRYDPVGNLLSIARHGSGVVSVAAVNPNSAAVGAPVTIYGTGFSTTASENTVSFNGMAAAVSAATATQLTTTVPGGASSGTVTVSAPGGSAQSSSAFAVRAARTPAVTAVSPGSGVPGDSVTIGGSGFETAAANDVVAFNQSRARVTSAAAGALTATVPSAVSSGRVRVFTPYGAAAWSGDFYVPPSPYTPSSIGWTGRTTVGGTATTTISTAGKVGLLLFDGTARQRVFLRFTGETFSGQTLMKVYDPFGTQIASGGVCCGGGASDNIDTTTLPVTGTYTILVIPGSSATGSLTTTIYNVPPDPTGTLTIGGAALTLTMNAIGQNASATFEGTANQRVFFNFTNDTIGGTTTMRVYKPDGGLLLLKQICCGGGASDYVDTTTLPASGTYRITYDPPGTNTGSITTRLYNVPADASGTLTIGGAALTLSTTAIGQNASATFEGTANQRVFFNFSNDTIGGTTTIRVYKPDGNQWLFKQICCGGGASDYVDATTLPASGTYRISYDPPGTNTGSITTRLYDVPADATATLTIGGPAVTITTTTPGQNARLPFDGPATKTIRLVLSGVTISSSRVSIQKPDGSNLVAPTSVGTGGATITSQLTVAGTYTVVVDPQGTATGNMTLTLTDPPAAPAQSTISFNGTRVDRPQAERSVPAASPRGAGRGRAGPTPHSGRPPAREPASYSPPYPEEWEPGERNQHGDWRTGRVDTPWRALPPLQADPDVTALAGQALTLNGLPLADVTVRIEGSEASARTDDTGRFLLAPAPAGRHVLLVDGGSAGTAGKPYGVFEVALEILARQTNDLGFTLWMPRLDKAREVEISQPTTKETVLTSPRMPGLEVHIPAGVKIIGVDGKPVSSLSLTAAPVDRPPFPLPLGIDVPLYFTLQPGGAYLTGGLARIIYPNYGRLPAGQRIEFWTYDPDKGGWYVYGLGRVSADGTKLVPDPGVGVWKLTGAMISGSLIPPDWWRKLWQLFSGGDPVDAGSGLFVYEKTDLALPGPIPLALTRTYRQRDNNSYAFGIGTTMSYELRLWSNANYQQADLILPGGTRVHYVRTSAGTGYTDAVYESTSTPTVFYKSKLAYNGTGWNLTLKDGTVYVFPDNAPLSAIRDRFGNQITLTRSGGLNGPISQVTATGGRWIKFTYDAGNRVTQASDNTGRAVNYGYDGSGRLTSVTDAKGGPATYTYDAANRMLTVRDPRQITFLTNQYDANGRVAQQTQADSSTYQFAYTLDGNGNVTQTDITDSRGTVSRVAFNGDGYATSDTEALGKPEQQQTSYERQAGSGLLLSVTDPLGRQTAYGYDSKGNVTSLTRLAGTGNALTTSFAYEPTYSQLTSVTDPLNHTTSYAYDSKGALASTTDPLNHTTSVTANPSGQPTSVTDALNQTTTLTYELGDLASVTDPLGNASKRFVDNAGRLVSVTDPLGNVTRTDYDPLNEPTQVTDPDDNTASFAYDANGNLTSLTDARGKVTTYEYNAMDRLTGRTDPLNRAESYAYDANGNLTRFTDRKGQVASFSYDALDRRTFAGFKTSAGAPDYQSTIEYGYDAADRLTSAVDSIAGTITDGYDDLDRLSSETTPEGSVGYGYDGADRRTQMTVAGQPTVSYGYDAADRLTSITQGGAGVGLGYDDADRRTSTTLPNGIVESYGYDAGSQLTAITYARAGSTLGELNYAYDAAGNRTALWGSYARTNLPQPLASATYDAANQLTNWAGTSLSYDDNGQLTDNGTNTYSWNARGQLTSIAGPTSGSFGYDALGRRQSKTIDGTTTKFLYDGANPVQELTGGGAPTANLLGGLAVDEIFSRTDTDGARSYLTDVLGSTIALADSTGALQTSYTYDPFGTATTSGNTSANSFQYTGRENDGSGLHYYRARYYSPALQRFTSEDPLGFGGGDQNLYSYVANDPAGTSDPSGEDIGGGVLTLSTCLLSGRKTTAHVAACVAAAVVLGIVPVPTEELAAAAARAASARPVVSEGIYQVATVEGKTYVGESGNLTKRLVQHVRSGKITQAAADAAVRTEVKGGKLAREIAEQQRINQLGGIKNLANKRNPIGPRRRHLMP